LNKPITFDKSTGKGMTDVVILWCFLKDYVGVNSVWDF